ncbi:hypothetical protein ACTWP5_22295 [Streptomyces sp. 4N509B]|uniref:hypothetical protein n=1 Tax=Streptomyces sp. 4N509B TaxID=3457413 RepID=UPI003FD6B109
MTRPRIRSALAVGVVAAAATAALAAPPSLPEASATPVGVPLQTGVCAHATTGLACVDPVDTQCHSTPATTFALSNWSNLRVFYYSGTTCAGTGTSLLPGLTVFLPQGQYSWRAAIS